MRAGNVRRPPYLLDINVLIALAWPNHVHHGEALAWFRRKASAGFRTCPATQLGFVRISSNLAFTAAAVAPSEALELLERITRLPGHGFWPDDLAAGEALRERKFITGHRQVTDGYLVALAVKHGGTVATLDRAMMAMAAGAPGAVESIFDKL